MELNPQMALLQAAMSNTRGQHTARGRRRAMQRAIDKLTSKYNKSNSSSLEEHEE